jgi:hypothetical protein
MDTQHPTTPTPFPISNRGEPPPDLSDIPDAQPLPDWLTAHDPNTCPTKPPRLPRTKDHIELEELNFATVFETVLDVVIEGGSVVTYLREYPTKINYGRFQKWLRKDKERQRLYEEAQEIGTEALLEKMDEIAAGTDTLEDIERSKLRLAQYKFKVQAWNKRRYGDLKQVELNVTTVNMRELLDQRENQLRILDGEFQVIDNGG